MVQPRGIPPAGHHAAQPLPATTFLVSGADTSRPESGHALRTPNLYTKNQHCLPEQKVENINFERHESK